MIRGIGLLAALVAAIATFMIPSPAAAQPGFSTHTTVRIAVKYQKGIPPEEAEALGAFLQREYDYISGRLHVDLPAPLEVRMYDSGGKYLAATGQQNAWRPAVLQRGILHMQPVTDPKRQGAFEKGISYELARAVLEGTGRKGVPRWLREAFAAYYSGVMSDLTPPVGARIRSFADLDQDLQRHTAPPRRDDVVYLLGQTMKFFIDEFGEDKAYGVFAAFDGEHGLEETMTAHFGTDFKQVEQSWAAAMAHQSEPFKKSPPPDRKE